MVSFETSIGYKIAIQLKKYCIRSVANYTYLAAHSQDNFSWVPCCSQGPTKCNVFGPEEKTCLGYVNRTISMATHYTILNNEGIQSKLIITQPVFQYQVTITKASIMQCIEQLVHVNHTVIVLGFNKLT